MAGMRREGLVLGLVALLLVGGGVRLARIEASEGETLRQKAERQQSSERVLPALRGEILDTRGRVLASTVRQPSVYVDPAMVQDPQYAACSLGPVLGLDPVELEAVLRNPPRPHFVWLKRGLAEEDLEVFLSVVEKRRLRGFGVQYESARVYPQGRLAPHVLGFVGLDLKPAEGTGGAYEDLRGLAGIEEAYDKVLAGQPGWRAAIVDARRQRVRGEETEPAVDGATIVLTIDSYIQHKTEDVLRAAVDKHKAEWGVAVVLDPQSGEVLAMATMPDFDPAQPRGPNPEALTERQRARLADLWRNRAVADAYEPGSVFKPFIAAAALNDGIVQMEEVFQINGPVRKFGRRSIRDTHAYGALPVRSIIGKSSNIGMGLIGARCGIERLHDYVCRYGFGEMTGVGLAGESTGLVLELADWNPSFSPQSIPIGQEIAVTSIQIVTAFSVFCNGGQLLRPRVVRGVIGADGETLEDNSEPVFVRQVLDAKTAAAMRQVALVEVVREGTGKTAQLDDYQVFGKTGTAQVAWKDRKGYEPGKYVGSFVGGAPSDVPRVVVLVSIYKPSKEGYYGGVVAAPAVREIIAETLAYMQVPPELDSQTTGRRGLPERRR